MKIDLDTIILVTKLVKKVLKNQKVLDNSNNLEKTIEDVLDIVIKAPDILSLEEDNQVKVVSQKLFKDIG